MEDGDIISAFLKALFDDAWNRSSVVPIGRQYILPYVSEIKRFDPIDVIAQMATSFDRRDNIALLLSTPELWKDLRKADWSRIMYRIAERPRLRFGESFGEYTDIEFLVCYLIPNAYFDRVVPHEVLSVSKVVVPSTDQAADHSTDRSQTESRGLAQPRRWL